MITKLLDLDGLSTEQLLTSAGIMESERMLFARSPEIEAVVDAWIALIRAEVSLRAAVANGHGTNMRNDLGMCQNASAAKSLETWSGRRESNPRPLAWENTQGR